MSIFIDLFRREINFWDKKRVMVESIKKLTKPLFWVVLIDILF